MISRERRHASVQVPHWHGFANRKSDHGDENGDLCPLRGTRLSADGRAFMRTDRTDSSQLNLREVQARFFTDSKGP